MPTSEPPETVKRPARSSRRRESATAGQTWFPLRYAEFGSPALPRITEAVLTSLLTSALLAFIVLLLPLLILEERAIVLGREWKQMDALGRYVMGIAFLALVALVPPTVAAWHWAGVSIRRAIEEQAPAHPNLVATPEQLKRDPRESRKALRLCLWIYAGICGGIGGLLFIVGLVGLADDVPDSIQAVWIGGITLALGLVVTYFARRLRGDRRTHSPRKTWSDDQVAVIEDMAEIADDQQERRLPASVRAWRIASRVLSATQYALFTLTALLGVMGVFARQPCRSCEPRSYGPGVEMTLDRFWIVIGVLALVTAVVLLVWGVVEVMASWLTRRELVRRIDAGEGDLARPEDTVLRSVVGTQHSGPWAVVSHHASLWTMGPLLVGAVWLLVADVGHTIYAEFAQIGWTLLLVGLGLLALTVLATAVDEHTSSRVRDRFRAAWPIDDRPGAKKNR